MRLSRPPLLLALACLLVANLCEAQPPSPVPAPDPSPTLTLAAVGDILLDRGVAQKMERFGINYPFQQVGGILSTADLAFGNLECPLSEKGIRVIKPFTFQAKPEASRCLVKGGFDILSLANNHTMDCGRTGLTETMDRLKSEGLHWCGAGSDQAEAESATVLEVKGLKVAFVGFCEFLPEGVFLRDDKPTIAFASEDSVQRAVKAAKQEADIVVASFHWGAEFRSRPTELQMKLAHLAVEAGADLVLGHHPHVLQGFEVSAARPAGAACESPACEGRQSLADIVGQPNPRRSLIAYSLGNFVFDPRPGLAATDSVILRCRLGKNGIVGAEVLAVEIDQCRPRRATASESKSIFAKITRLSGELNTVFSGGRIMLEGKAVHAE